MQGKVSAHFRHFPARGITPACAGKSPSSFVLLLPVRDHPRVCGEKGNGATISQKCVGITPACAGKSLPAVLKCPPTRDHPRVCGEKRRVRSWRALLLGSPPRMRGKVVLSSENPLCRGITPAYAGKRLKRSHSIGHFSCILCLFHSVLHRASVSGGSRAGPRAPPCLPAQNTVPV